MSGVEWHDHLIAASPGECELALMMGYADDAGEVGYHAELLPESAVLPLAHRACFEYLAARFVQSDGCAAFPEGLATLLTSEATAGERVGDGFAVCRVLRARILDASGSVVHERSFPSERWLPSLLHERITLARCQELIPAHARPVGCRLLARRARPEDDGGAGTETLLAFPEFCRLADLEARAARLGAACGPAGDQPRVVVAAAALARFAEQLVEGEERGGAFLGEVGVDPDQPGSPVVVLDEFRPTPAEDGASGPAHFTWAGDALHAMRVRRAPAGVLALAHTHPPIPGGPRLPPSYSVQDRVMHRASFPGAWELGAVLGPGGELTFYGWSLDADLVPVAFQVYEMSGVERGGR